MAWGRWRQTLIFRYYCTQVWDSQYYRSQYWQYSKYYYCTPVWDSQYSQSDYRRYVLTQAPWNLAEDQLLPTLDCVSSATSRRLIIGTASASFWFLICKLVGSISGYSTSSCFFRRLELGRIWSDLNNLKMQDYKENYIYFNQYIPVTWCKSVLGFPEKTKLSS